MEEKTVNQASAWEDYDDDGGFDDDIALIGKLPILADRISEIGFRELLGFEQSAMTSVLRREG